MHYLLIITLLWAHQPSQKMHETYRTAPECEAARRLYLADSSPLIAENGEHVRWTVECVEEPVQ
jgi:hypothetical protein